MENLEKVAKLTKKYKYDRKNNPYFMAIYFISRDMFIFWNYSDNKTLHTSHDYPAIVINGDHAMSAQELADAAYYGMLERRENKWLDPCEGYIYPSLIVVDKREKPL